jgi:hypothetical protein
METKEWRGLCCAGERGVRAGAGERDVDGGVSAGGGAGGVGGDGGAEGGRWAIAGSRRVRCHLP